MTKGCVYLRGKIYWIRYYYKGKDRCESSRSTDKKDAELLLAKRLGEIGADISGVKRWLGPEAERTPVSRLLDDLLVEYQVSGKRAITSLLGRLKPLQESFYREQVREVDTPRLRRYMQERQRAGKSPATIKLELAFLHRAFVLAHREGRIGQVPVFPSIEVDNARQGFFEQADFEAVCALLSPVLADIARFAYLSGWRKREVTALEWAEVDLAGRVAKLSPERSKNKRGRTLPLVGELWEIMRRRAIARTIVIPLVFHREGEPIGDFKHAWGTACRKAGVQGMVFHDLRRTAIRSMVRAGVPDAVCMAISGHKTRSVFDRYNIVSEKDLRDAMEKVGDYLREVGESGETQAVANLSSRKSLRG